MWASGSGVGIEKRSMSDGKEAGFYVELQSTGSRDFERVVLRPPRTTYFPGAFLCADATQALIFCPGEAGFCNSSSVANSGP